MDLTTSWPYNHSLLLYIKSHEISNPLYNPRLKSLACTPGSDWMKMRWQPGSYYGNKSNDINGIGNPFPPDNVRNEQWRIYHDKQHWIGGKGDELINLPYRYCQSVQACQDLLGIVVSLRSYPVFNQGFPSWPRSFAHWQLRNGIRLSSIVQLKNVSNAAL